MTAKWEDGPNRNVSVGGAKMEIGKGQMGSERAQGKF